MALEKAAAAIYCSDCQGLSADFAAWKASQKHAPIGSVLIAIISSEHSMRMRKDPYALWLYLMKLGAAAGCHQRPDRRSIKID